MWPARLSGKQQQGRDYENAALAHFDEDQGLAVAHDQVDLAQLTPEIRFDRHEAVALKIRLRRIFPRFPLFLFR